MKNAFLIFNLLSTLTLRSAFGWGETGHHLIGRTAARILEFNPRIQEKLKNGSSAEKTAAKDFLALYERKNIQQGHISNIPDIHYRNLDGGLFEDGQILGDTTHYLDPEVVLPISKPEEFFKVKLPLSYEEAKNFALKANPSLDFFHQLGTAPWRSQQFYDLYTYTLAHYPKTCTGLPYETHPTLQALTYAGLISHFIGDASNPYHATVDYDGIATNQKGIHSYFESDLVDYLEGENLAGEVSTLARTLTVESGTDTVTDFLNRSRFYFPSQDKTSEVTALLFTLLGDSYQWLNAVRSRDQQYGIATLEEALEFPHCKNTVMVKKMKTELEHLTSPKEKNALLAKKVMGDKNAGACRRLAGYPVEGKATAVWFRDLIVKRLAVSSALLSELWAKGFLENGLPKLCGTYQYALKPSFVSPTDPKCFGYALNENPSQFLKKDKTSALPWKKSAPSTDQCLHF